MNHDEKTTEIEIKPYGSSQNIVRVDFGKPRTQSGGRTGSLTAKVEADHPSWVLRLLVVLLILALSLLVL